MQVLSLQASELLLLILTIHVLDNHKICVPRNGIYIPVFMEHKMQTCIVTLILRWLSTEYSLTCQLSNGHAQTHLLLMLTRKSPLCDWAGWLHRPCHTSSPCHWIANPLDECNVKWDFFMFLPAFLFPWYYFHCFYVLHLDNNENLCAFGSLLIFSYKAQKRG